MQLGAYRFQLCLAVAGLLVACGEEPAPLPETVRPIRTFTVTEVASGQARRFSGTIEASDSSSLSFQVSGNVLEVEVDQGEQVTAGQVLAVLDAEPFELDVKAAEAELEKARAVESQKLADFERQSTLYQQGWVARARYDTAERDYSSAQSQVGFAVARLNLAQRDLRNTTLAAPFGGFISERSIDPFVEVRAGQELFQIDAEGGLEAAFGVPETTIDQVVLGMPAVINIPQLVEPAEARITEIGSAAGAGNTFPVRAALLETPASIRPGMTAEVSLLLTRENETGGFLVPVSALAPGDGDKQGFVFVYDRATSTVNRTPVVATFGPQAGNTIAITGVTAGDVLASAGVNFLVDGQKVELLAPVVAVSDG